MVLNSLANTTKISGTNVNTVVLDEWTEWSPKKAESDPPVYLNFNTPPLALVIAMQEVGKQGHEIFETLKGVGKSKINLENVVTVEHQKTAAEIYEHFVKKYTMRRIKGEHISDFMLAVEDLSENRKRINEEHIKILISLPSFYKNNKQLERIMSKHKSTKKINNLPFASWKAEVEFVDKVHIKHRHLNEVHYYFSTPKKYLMRIVVKKGEYGETAWNTLSQAGKLYIDSPAIYTYNIRGYDFNVLQPALETEIKLV